MRTNFQYKASQTISGFHKVWSWMLKNVSKKRADSILESKKGVKFYTEVTVSLTHISCRHYGQSELREGGKGYNPIRNTMMMMMMMKKENFGKLYSLNLALHVNFPNYYFGSSQIR